MVGRRHRVPEANGHLPKRYEDIETGRQNSTAARFRDAAHVTLSDRRREDLKRKLIQGIDRNWLQPYRKTPEEVSIALPFSFKDGSSMQIYVMQLMGELKASSHNAYSTKLWPVF